MARLGEQLTNAGLVSAEKVEQALRAQVVWGGRLGTNLIELGCIDIDELSRALGQQHAIPAALARHFERADPELQAKLTADLAQQYMVVPLVRLSDERIAVVAIDPLGPHALAALARVYGVDPKHGIVSSVAAEMRVLYYLERVYKIARPARYLRTKNAGATMEFPAFDNVPVEIDDSSEHAIPIEIDQTVQPTARAMTPEEIGNAREIAAQIDHAIDAVTLPRDDEPHGRARRTYLRTLADAVEPIRGDEETLPVANRALGPDAPVEGERPNAPEGATPALGRIAIRRVAVHASELAPVASSTGSIPIIPTNFVDATRAIKRGPNRDRVVDLLLESIERFVPSCQAAMLLVIRGDVAIGWKHFSRAGAGTIDIAVPLDQSGLVPAAISTKHASRETSAALGAIDGRLLRAMGCEAGDLVCVPISIANRVMCVLACALEDHAEASPVESVAAATAAAFARLIRDASR